jgi:hypothetical protein
VPALIEEQGAVAAPVPVAAPVKVKKGVQRPVPVPSRDEADDLKDPYSKQGDLKDPFQ